MLKLSGSTYKETNQHSMPWTEEKIMGIKTITIISLLLLPTPYLKANPFLSQSDKDKPSLTNAGFMTDIVGFDKIAIKRGQPYDESKDPALRKSVDKAGVLPWGALIMPIIVFLVFVFVFFRKKDFD